METHQQYQNILDTVLLKTGIVTLTGAKDDLGCHLITFQSQQQLLFTQIDYSSLIESLYVIIMYYKSPLVSFLVDMNHSNQMFIDHFIHVVDQLERKMSKSEIKSVYIVRPERKSIQKHLSKELGSKSKGNTRINAQVVIVKTFDELYQYIKQKNLTIDFGGTLQHDYRAWLSVQKMLTQYYVLVNNVVASSADVLQRIRDLTSGELGTRTPEKNTEHAQRKRLRNTEKKKNEILRRYSFTKAEEDGQRLHSYFQDPKLNENFQALSKSPVLELNKAKFQQYYRKILAVRDSIEHAWKEGVGKMKLLASEQELYDRLIECCTWIVEEGLPYLTSLPAQSKTLAEAVRQKINFENEFYKPVKVTLKKCRQTLKEVRHYQRSLRMSNGSLELMSDNLTSLVENLKTKSEERMVHFKKEKDFMQSLVKAESWCERASDLWPANQIPSTTQENAHFSPSMLIDSKNRFEVFLERHPPLTCKELEPILDYVDNIDDLELRNRARLLANRCQELERILRTREIHVGDVSGEELSSDQESFHRGNSLLKRRVRREDNQSHLRSTISTDVSSKRWHDDVMSSTTISNDDVTRSEATELGTGNKNSRLADIRRRLRDQELLYEQLILEEELREVAEKDGEGRFSSEQEEFSLSSSLGLEHQNWKNLVTPSTSGKAFEKCNISKQDKVKQSRNEMQGTMNLSSSLNRNSREAEVMDTMVRSKTSGKVFVKRKKQENDPELRNGGSSLMSLTSTLNRSSEAEKMNSMVKPSGGRAKQTVNRSAGEKKTAICLLPMDIHNTGCFDNGNWEKILRSEETEKQGKRNLPSHIDLLDGCDSLKRLCKLGDHSEQNNSITAFGTYHNKDERHVDNLSTQISTNSVLPNNNFSMFSSESVFGVPIESRSKDFQNSTSDRERSSRDHKEDSHGFENIATINSKDASPEALIKASSEAVEITRDSENRSRDLETRSHDPESSSREFESFSRDREDKSRDDENLSRDSNDNSREELLKNARDAADHWTRIKNEQRVRLAQVIDDNATRKEIEETYFNAQIQLCRARQNVTKLSKSDSNLASLSLSNDVINITSSFNSSLGLGTGGGQMLNGEGAFRRFVKNDVSVEQNSNSDETKGMMLDHEESLGIIGKNDGVEKEVVLDNEDSLGVTGGVKQDIREPLDSKEVSGDFTNLPPSEDRVLLQENSDGFDSEQGSSDDFDDDVEEEELMLLCSQSSSGLLSQDELKDSLQEEQARLEGMFRQQKQQLRMEREKLIEEEKRINEWEKGKLELKGESLSMVNGNLNVERSNETLQLANTENSILDNIGEKSQLHFAKNLQHETELLQHGIPQLKHDINGSQQESPNIPILQHDVLDLQHDIYETEHDTKYLPASRHEIPSPQHEIPAPQNEQTSPENEQRQQQHDMERRNLPQHEETLQHKRQGKERGIEHSRHLHGGGQQKQSSYFEALKQKDTLTTHMKSVDQNTDATTFRELKDSPERTVDETISTESDVNDLSQIVVSNFESDDESRKEIEEELINILQDRTLEMEGETSQERDQEFGPNFPPLGMDGSPPSMFDDNDDIDLMNQLIDDLMISDHDRANQDDYNRVSLDSAQMSGGNHRVDVDNDRVNVDNGSLNGDNVGVDVDKVGKILDDDDGINDCDIKMDVYNDGVNEDNGRMSEGNIGVDVHNVGINLDNDDGINEDDISIAVGSNRIDGDNGRISEGDIGVDVDNNGINLDDLGINEVDVDLGDLVIKADKPEANVDNYLIDSNIAGVHAGINRDGSELNDDNYDVLGDKVALGLDYRTKRIQNDSDDFRSGDRVEVEEMPYDMNERQRNGGLGLNVDSTIDLSKDSEAVQSNDLIELLSSHEATSDDDDRTLPESESPRNEELGLDVDFTIDLNKDSEAVQGNDLIDLLRNQSDAFSSQESLDVDDDHLSEGNSEKPETFKAERSDQLLGANSNSMRKGTLEQEGDLYGHQLQQDSEESAVGVNQKHPRTPGSTEDQRGIPEGHQLMSEESDDDFGRILEDIQEEESEYEDLMRYKGTQVDSNDNEVQELVKIIVPSTSDLRSARLAGHNMNLSENASSASFTSSIIIDPGTGYCKAGFSIDDQPRVLIPSVVGKPRSQVVNSGRYKDYYVGEEAKHLHQVLNLHHPLKNGLVHDWEFMEKLLDEVYEELRCESDQYPILLSEPVLNPKSKREEMIQVLFETFHVPAAYSCAQAALSLFATGRTTGLVYDCGYSKAYSVPVYEGYALPHATTTTELAGHELTTCLSRMLRDRGVTMETQAELDIVQDIKEKLCYAVVDYDSERKAYNIGERNDTTYTMPDGQTIAIGSERFRCPEVLFTPSMVGMATDGVHEVIYKTALQCPIDVRSSLFQNIVISGGSTMFPGFSRRLHVELCKLLGARTPDSININAVEDRNTLTWQGGAMLSKLSNFQSMWITSSEYEEFGPGIVHKKCV